VESFYICQVEIINIQRPQNTYASFSANILVYPSPSKTKIAPFIVDAAKPLLAVGMLVMYLTSVFV